MECVYAESESHPFFSSSVQSVYAYEALHAHTQSDVGINHKSGHAGQKHTHMRIQIHTYIQGDLTILFTRVTCLAKPYACSHTDTYIHTDIQGRLSVFGMHNMFGKAMCMCSYRYIHAYIHTDKQGHLSIHGTHDMFGNTICLIMPFSESARVQYPRSAVFWIRGQPGEKYVPTGLCGLLESIDVRPARIYIYIYMYIYIYIYLHTWRQAGKAYVSTSFTCLLGSNDVQPA
jgi:hypothetical protein